MKFDAKSPWLFIPYTLIDTWMLGRCGAGCHGLNGSRPGPNGVDMKVLVIEDIPEVVTTIRVCFTIRWPDTIVISSENGGDAVGLVESGSPDIVILDLSLPDMNGLDVLQEIRRFSDLPVIIVTAHDEEIVKVSGLELGAYDFLVKPFSHTELMARAKAVLRRTHMPQLRGDEGVSGDVACPSTWPGVACWLRARRSSLPLPNGSCCPAWSAMKEGSSPIGCWRRGSGAPSS